MSDLLRGKPAKARAVIAEIADRRGVPLPDLIGPHRRKTAPVVAARHEIIVALYDPSTAGIWDERCKARWGLSRIGAVLDCHHTTVLHAVRLAGVWRAAQ